jgi:hypothetical protein
MIEDEIMSLVRDAKCLIKLDKTTWQNCLAYALG